MADNERLLRRAARCAAQARAYTLMARASLWLARAEGTWTPTTLGGGGPAHVENAQAYRQMAKGRRAEARILIERAFR